MDVKTKVCSFESLYKAMMICKSNVLWKDSVAGWVSNGLSNCLKLHEDLLTGKYKISTYSRFVIYEPKRRDVTSTRFKDRVFQRSLCDNYLTAEVSRSFIWDNAACMNDKGTQFARKRLKCHLQRYWRKYGLNGYTLKMDLHNFFGSTPHSVVKAAIAKRVSDPWAYNEVCRIIDSFDHGPDPTVGMGLGSQVTQLSQLAVLDDLDHFIKEQLHIKFYVRYMDDLILLHPDKAYLRYCWMEIEKRLQALGLTLNTRKTQIAPIKQPIRFLGFSFRLTKTGKVVQKLLPEKVSRERRKLRKLVGLARAGIMTREHVDDCFQSWKAHAEQGDCYHLICEMTVYYFKLWEENSYGIPVCSAGKTGNRAA